jgi:hypothetical protein
MAAIRAMIAETMYPVRLTSDLSEAGREEVCRDEHRGKAQQHQQVELHEPDSAENWINVALTIPERGRLTSCGGPFTA